MRSTISNRRFTWWAVVGTVATTFAGVLVFATGVLCRARRCRSGTGDELIKTVMWTNDKEVRKKRAARAS